MVHASIPADFPVQAGLGGVPGAQPKVLVRLEAGRFIGGPTELEIAARVEVCVDLVEQLAQYCARKALELPEWTQRQLLAKVSASVKTRAAGWNLSPAEAGWVLQRLAKRIKADSRPSGAAA